MNADPEPTELPEVWSAELDGALFEALLDDIERCARVESVRVRGRDGAVDLLHARLLLVTGAAREIQLRYEHDGARWIDTLVRQPASIALVRTRNPDQPERPRRRLPVL